MNLFRPITVVVVAALAIAACGGGDDNSSPLESPAITASPSDTSASTAAAPDGDDPVPTIPDGVPEEFLPGIGPIATVGTSLPALPESGDDPAIGSAGPVLIGEDYDGNSVKVDPATDGPTWLVFLAHWCPHCNDEIPVINQLAADGRIPDGVDVVGVSTAVNPGRPNFPPGEWLDDKGWLFRVLADGVDLERQTFVAAEAYGVSSFPFSVLVDGEGAVVDRWSGGRSADELESMLVNGLALG